MKDYPFAAFSGYGIEIEHMIVEQDTFKVAPLADKLLATAGVAEDMDIERGKMAWSNELALHVVEMKTNGPTNDLAEAMQLFRGEVDELNRRLAPMNACLLPGGMHGGMMPLAETRLWPHQNDEIYKAFDRIFDCRGHGWSNLQSTHINFPFQTEAEFGVLHAACRFVLPLLPALAASSPFIEGHVAEHRDQRLHEYQKNCAKVPSVAGIVIPEAVFDEAAYQRLLETIYSDLAPHDPEAILAEEWVNARGCIARFDRGAIEIRLLDAQECPEQDLAIVHAVTHLVQGLAQGHFAPVSELMKWDAPRLRRLLDASIHLAEGAEVHDDDYLRAFRADPRDVRTMGQLWKHLMVEVCPSAGPFAARQRLLLEEGSLSSRLLKRLGRNALDASGLESFNRSLSQCLARGEAYLP